MLLKFILAVIFKRRKKFNTNLEEQWADWTENSTLKRICTQLLTNNPEISALPCQMWHFHFPTKSSVTPNKQNPLLPLDNLYKTHQTCKKDLYSKTDRSSLNKRWGKSVHENFLVSFTIGCLQETHFRPEGTFRLKVRGWTTIYHATGSQKKAGVPILISDKLDFKLKAVTRDEEGHYIIIKGLSIKKS